MSGLLSDLRSAWRLMGRYRSTSILILLTLTLGLGVNVAVFAIARGIILRPLPYDEPDRLVMIWAGSEPRRPGAANRGVFTPAWFHELVARQRSFSSIAALESWDGNMSAVFDLPTAQGAERLRGAFTTTNFFTTIGVSAAAGRTFAPDDPADVAIISHELWQSLFAGADVVGRRLELATGRGKERTLRPLTIIGVLPPRVQFTYPESTDVWLPLPPQQLHNPRLQGANLYRLVARLQPGTTLPQAQADLATAKTALAADLKRDYSKSTWWLEPVHDYAVGAARPAVQLLSGIAALVFFVACLNVATLLLAQTVERRRAFAVQLALGASRRRVMRQLLTEGSLMAMLAAAFSVASVAVLQPVLRATIPGSIPRISEIGIDLVTMGWVTALVTVDGGPCDHCPGMARFRARPRG
jgi:putative ABC transport system permease protein